MFDQAKQGKSMKLYHASLTRQQEAHKEKCRDTVRPCDIKRTTKVDNLIMTKGYNKITYSYID